MSNPTSTSALQSASTQQPLKTKCTQFMEAHYGGNFIEQSSKTWIPTTPEILMSDKSLGLALMGQTNPLLETTNKGTHVDMLDKKLYACLMELAEKGTGSLLVFFESSYARVFRFVEFDQQTAWKASINLGLANLRNLTLADPRADGYILIINPRSPDPSVT